MQLQETVDEAIRSAHEIRSLAVGFKVRLPPGHAARYAEQWLRREGSKLVAVTLRNDVFKVCDHFITTVSICSMNCYRDGGYTRNHLTGFLGAHASSLGAVRPITIYVDKWEHAGRSTSYSGVCAVKFWFARPADLEALAAAKMYFYHRISYPSTSHIHVSVNLEDRSSMPCVVHPPTLVGTQNFSQTIIAWKSEP